MELQNVIDLWATECGNLGKSHAWVQLFENKGAMMGASSPHPHGQVWATSVVPTIARREDVRQRDYAVAGDTLLLDYARRELAVGDRIVARNARWCAIVPYWAAWPFETLLLPLEHRLLGATVDLLAQRRIALEGDGVRFDGAPLAAPLRLAGRSLAA